MHRAPDNYSPPQNLLRNRRVLITGAGDGLGRATALACAGLGATVVLLGRTTQKLERVYDEIRALGAPEPAIVPMNLAGASAKDYMDLGQTLEQELGGLDVLIHCAAHFTGFTPMELMDPKTWIETLQVNLTAPFALTQQLLPLLKQSADGRIVFISDIHGREAHPYDGAYGIAKAAAEQMMQIWAEELRRDSSLKILSYDPGKMRTSIRRKGYPGEMDRETPPADEAVPALLWLLDPASEVLNGGAYSRLS